jgi:hypothetical protein
MTPSSAGPARPVPRVTGLPAGTLLRLARHGLLEAVGAATPAERYAAAHLAALRAAAAVLACRARPTGSARRSRPTSAWVLLAAVAPELAEWAEFFAAGARKRAAAEAGLTGAVTVREADDLVREAEQFLLLVETTLSVHVDGLSRQSLLRTTG